MAAYPPLCTVAPAAKLHWQRCLTGQCTGHPSAAVVYRPTVGFCARVLQAGMPQSCRQMTACLLPCGAVQALCAAHAQVLAACLLCF